MLQLGAVRPLPRIRPCRLADLPAVMRIERASFRRDAYPRELFLEYHERGALFLVAVARGEISGYALAVLQGARAELISIAVAPAYRRTGAGKSLMQSLLRRLRRAGAVRLNLIVKVTNHGAQRFYDWLGFQRVRRVPAYYEDGRDGLLLSRPL